MSARRAALCAVALAACGERYAAFGDRQIEHALGAAARVRPDVVAASVQAIYAARLADDDTSFDYTPHCPVPGCRYSRAATRAWIERTLGDALPGASELRLQTVDRDGLATTNLILDLPAAASDEWVLATAHYDAWFGGANDNASGVAVLVEAASALQGLALDRNVRLVFTDGEELGIVGSVRYLEEYGSDGVAVALNADMLAHVGDRGSLLTREPEGIEYIVQGNQRSAAEAFALADLARRLPEPIAAHPVIFPDDGVSVLGFAVGAALSDHAPFWLAGRAAVFPFPAGDKPSWYHTERDRPEQVDPDRLARASRWWAAALAALATVP